MRSKINEIFNSLQGEGFYAGSNCTFVRLSGCNLRCAFCDTAHQQGREMSDEEIAQECLRYATKRVVLTGGEPTQYNLEPLVRLLHKDGFVVAMETNGTRNKNAGVDWVTCSPKFAFCDNAEVKLSHIDELKVLYDGESFDSALYDNIIAENYYLQPIDTGSREENAKIICSLVKYITKHPKWQLSLQLHKILNVR